MDTLPALTIYAVRDASGALEPVAAAVGGFSLPILGASIHVDANGRKHGTRALVGEVAFKVGAGSGIVEVDSPDDVPELASFEAVET